MTPPRLTRGKHVARQLGPRDWAVLEDVARLRLLTARQIERLHVATGSPLTRARRARALTKRLHDLGLLTRLQRRVGGVHAGSAGHIYALGTLGQRLLGTGGPAGGVRRRRYWEPSAPFVDHIVAVSELYVSLRERQAAGLIEDLIFEPEPLCWRRWTGSAGEQLILKPDAYCSFAAGDSEHHCFVELDNATESRSVIRRKAETYVDYWQTGTEQQRLALFPRVLFLVPDLGRLEQITSVLGWLDAESWPLFVVQLQAGAADWLVRPPP